jgi:hypothetical protein
MGHAMNDFIRIKRHGLKIAQITSQVVPFTPCPTMPELDDELPTILTRGAEHRQQSIQREGSSRKIPSFFCGLFV